MFVIGEEEYLTLHENLSATSMICLSSTKIIMLHDAVDSQHSDDESSQQCSDGCVEHSISKFYWVGRSLYNGRKKV